MKLAIPKPIVEHDHSEAVADVPMSAVPRAWDDPRYRPPLSQRNPDYTDSGSYSEGENNRPIAAVLRPIDSENSSSHIDAEIKRLYRDDCISDGFKPGAVIVHTRVQPAHRLNTLCWGLVVSFNTETEIKGSPWKPLRVRWLNGSYEDCNPSELKLLILVPDKSILLARATRAIKPNPL